MHRDRIMIKKQLFMCPKCKKIFDLGFNEPIENYPDDFPLIKLNGADYPDAVFTPSLEIRCPDCLKDHWHPWEISLIGLDAGIANIVQFFATHSYILGEPQFSCEGHAQLIIDNTEAFLAEEPEIPATVYPAIMPGYIQFRQTDEVKSLVDLPKTWKLEGQIAYEDPIGKVMRIQKALDWHGDTDLNIFDVVACKRQYKYRLEMRTSDLMDYLFHHQTVDGVKEVHKRMEDRRNELYEYLKTYPTKTHSTFTKDTTGGQL